MVMIANKTKKITPPPKKKKKNQPCNTLILNLTYEQKPKPFFG